MRDLLLLLPFWACRAVAQGAKADAVLNAAELLMRSGGFRGVTKAAEVVGDGVLVASGNGHGSAGVDLRLIVGFAPKLQFQVIDFR